MTSDPVPAWTVIARRTTATFVADTMACDSPTFATADLGTVIVLDDDIDIGMGHPAALRIIFTKAE